MSCFSWLLFYWTSGLPLTNQPVQCSSNQHEYLIQCTSLLLASSSTMQQNNVRTNWINLFMSMIEILTLPADARGLTLGPEPSHTAQKSGICYCHGLIALLQSRLIYFPLQFLVLPEVHYKIANHETHLQNASKWNLCFFVIYQTFFTLLFSPRSQMTHFIR